MALLSLLVGFIAGAVAVIAFEAVGLLYLLRRCILQAKSTGSPSPSARPLSGPGELPDLHQSLSSIYKKQGPVWVLEPEKVPKITVAGERNRRKEIFEVSPLRKFAKIRDRFLILTESDGSLATIMLKGCKIVAVSSSSLSSKKWAKRYPIKVESKTMELYNGSKILYIYLETCSEKESWCKALRLASCDDKERLKWLSKLYEEFHSYVRSLSEGYPSLVKPSLGSYAGPLNKASGNDFPPSKVRTFLRKFSKRASKNLGESELLSASFSRHEERRTIEKCRSLQDVPLRNAHKGKITDGSLSAHSGNQTHLSELSDSEADEKFVVDEGTLCLNLLISRLFFDAKSNVDIKNALRARIQRSLSNMRIPRCIGEITCTDVDPGDLPPHIHGMRAIPTDMNDVWILEMDIEYSGGIVLYIEARFEVCEPDLQNNALDPNIEASSDGGETADLLEGFEHLGEELKLSGRSTNSVESKDINDTKVDKIKSFNTTGTTPSSESRWKSILNSIAKQVNQVPFTLAVRVASLRGTMQLHIKPPPSDQLWIGFPSMPDINFHLEPSVGEHKITSNHIALFLVNRFKAFIRETLVLPNCESVCIPWMAAEKDDWVPRNVAPFVWRIREAPSTPATVTEATRDHNEKKQQKPTKSSSVERPESSSRSLQSEESQEASLQTKDENAECQSPSRYVSLKEERNNLSEEDDGRNKRVGRRARMRELGKKMSEKLEEKRRHLEEKSRNIVEKMRTPSASSL
ncbi:hypothetical protein Ancab_012632 [Ancistrocladus abbreviatus]